MNTRPLYSVVARALLLPVLLAWGCDEKPKASHHEAAPPAASSAPVKAEPEPERMPQVTVTPSSIQIGLDSLRWDAPSFDKFYKAKLKKLPVSMPNAVVCNIDRKVKTPKAVKAIYGLFDAGAKAVEVRTKPRGTFPGKLTLTSVDSVKSNVPSCTFVAMILDNLKATFWHARGGLAKMYTKGMAGPDLSAMHEVMFKEASGCHSTVFLFSAQKNVDWGHAFDLGVSVGAHKPPYEMTKFVLLREEPVPGKPVKFK